MILAAGFMTLAIGSFPLTVMGPKVLCYSVATIIPTSSRGSCYMEKPCLAKGLGLRVQGHGGRGT